MKARWTWHVWVEALLLFGIFGASGYNFRDWRWWVLGVLAGSLSVVSYIRGLNNGREMMKEVWGDDGREYKRYN